MQILTDCCITYILHPATSALLSEQYTTSPAYQGGPLLLYATYQEYQTEHKILGRLYYTNTLGRVRFQFIFVLQQTETKQLILKYTRSV